MGEIPSLLNGFTPGALGIWTLVVMGVAFFAREWRETRKLSADDRQARREGYAEQVKSLRSENRALRKELAVDREEHTEYRRLCQAETDQLRRQVVALEDEVTGLKRELSAHSVAEIRTRPEASEEVLEAARRTAAHLRKR